MFRGRYFRIHRFYSLVSSFGSEDDDDGSEDCYYLGSCDDEQEVWNENWTPVDETSDWNTIDGVIGRDQNYRHWNGCGRCSSWSHCDCHWIEWNGWVDVGDDDDYDNDFDDVLREADAICVDWFEDCGIAVVGCIEGLRPLPFRHPWVPVLFLEWAPSNEKYKASPSPRLLPLKWPPQSEEGRFSPDDDE